MENVRDIELTDEEIWLRIYCAAVSNNRILYEPFDYADEGLKLFKTKFNKEE